MVTNIETQCSNAVRKEIALQLCLTLRFAPWLHFLCYINPEHHIGPSCYIIGNSKNEEYFWNYLRVPGNQYSVNSSWKPYCSATWLPVTLRNSFPTDLFPALRKKERVLVSTACAHTTIILFMPRQRGRGIWCYSINETGLGYHQSYTSGRAI